MTLGIREARAQDVDAMGELIGRYAAEDRMLPRSRDFLLEHLRDFYVAEDEGVFLGCCAIAVLTSDLAEVRSLAVRPEAGGKGVGRALMQRAIREAAARGKEALWLAVWERNAPAIDFYRRWEFFEAGSQPFKLGDDLQNDLVMVRRIARES